MQVTIWMGDKTQNKEYKRIFIMSDIHNHYQSYKIMRDRLGFSSDDLVIIDGDIVDRGGNQPDPLGICNEIRFSKKRVYDAIMIRGNHEQWLAEAIIRYCETGVIQYPYNSLGILASILPQEELLDYAKWMLELPLGIEMKVSGFRKKFKIAHASTVDFNSIEKSLMGSYDFYTECLKDRKHINVVGHTITSIVRYFLDDGDENNTDIIRESTRLWCIDCGNGYRDHTDFLGKLGCLELAEKGKVFEHYV